MPYATVDNPLTRAQSICPLCNGSKPRGLVACWPCYRETNMRNGNPVAEALITRFERALVEDRNHA